MSEWTPNDVHRLIMDPRYAGVAEFPRIIEDDMWARNNAKLLQEVGAKTYFEAQASLIRPAMAGDRSFASQWVNASVAALKASSSREAYFTKFLETVRSVPGYVDGMGEITAAEQAFRDVNRKLH